MATPAQRARRRRARARRASNKQQTPPVNQKRSTRSKGPGGSPALVNQVLAFSNPWSTQGPQKYHDGSNAKTIPYRMRYFHAITMGEDSVVSGYYRGGLMFLPRLKTPFYKPVYTANYQLPITSWSDTTEVFSEYAALAADQVKSYRITSWGVRIYSIGPPLTSSGIIVVRTITADDPTDDVSGPNAVAQNRFEQAISPGMDFYWQSKPTDTRSRNFQLIDSTIAVDLDNWTIPQIFVEGASSTTSIRCEVVVNVEFTAVPGDLFSRLVSPAPERNERFMDGVSRVFKYLPNIMPNADHGLGPMLLRGANAVATKLITKGVNAMMGGPVSDNAQLLLEY